MPPDDKGSRRAFHIGGANGAPARRVTRSIAALDFLLTVPMRNEAAVRSLAGDAPADAIIDGPVEIAPPPDDLEDSITLAEDAAAKTAAGGVRLRGRDATQVRVPTGFRRKTLRIPEQATIVRRWEGDVTAAGLPSARLFFSAGNAYPVCAFSVIQYQSSDDAARPKPRAPADGEDGEGGYRRPRDWRGVSYFELLHSVWTPCDALRDSKHPHPPIDAQPYHTSLLDDPEIRQGRHRRLMNGDANTGPIITSLLLYVTPKELKAELNNTFRAKHPDLPESITLSKIRSAKRQLLSCCRKVDVELATVALAVVYFEKLVLRGHVVKRNRKLSIAACLILALKFNEPMAEDEERRTIVAVLEEFDHAFSVSPKEVLDAEFGVFAKLSFDLHAQIHEVYPHFQRLVKLAETTPHDYLGDDMYGFHLALLHRLEFGEEAGKAGADGGDSEEEHVEEVDGEGDDDDDDDDDDDEEGEVARRPAALARLTAWFRR